MGTSFFPSDQMHYDVNSAFKSILCDLKHGEREIDLIEPIRNPELPTGLGTKVEGQSCVFVEDSRNGKVVRFGLPRIFSFVDPTSRVLQHRGRRANPFLHLYEAMWMLAGSNNVRQLTPFAKQMGEYSDDGATMHGAYGHRWRHAFGGDQLTAIINALKENPANRRLVLQMWDSRKDLQGFEYRMEEKEYYAREDHPKHHDTVPYSKDFPCNTHCYVQTRKIHVSEDSPEYQIAIDLTVMNRSNDIIWGMLGSNYVTFSFLLEYLAGMTGYSVGFYHHFTANAHIYLDMYPEETLWAWHDEEQNSSIFLPKDERIPLVTHIPTFDEECDYFVHRPLDGVRSYKNRFFLDVAQPMMISWDFYKQGDIMSAIDYIKSHVRQADWRTAAIDFIASSKAAKKLTAHQLS